MPLSEMADHILRTGLPARLFALARDEDLAERGDVSSQVSIDARAVLIARIVARQPGVVSGLAFAQALADGVATGDLGGVVIEPLLTDGQRVAPGDAIARVRGPARSVLAIERPLLNLLGRLSGIATLTANAVERIAGSRAVICDTRKTTPGLRLLEKYAVVCGGGTSHRMGLHDAVMLKDNHLAAMRREGESLAQAIERAALTARERWGDALSFVQIECDSLEQFAQVLSVPQGLVDLVLLDNMPPALLREAVRLRGDRPIGLEASGGITIDALAQVASTGIDRISLGLLTTRATGIDFGLDHEHSVPPRPAEPPLEAWADALEAVDAKGLVGRVVVVKQTGSTQDLARSMAMSDSAASQQNGLLVIAGTQTAGRGRLGRQWLDAPSNTLAMSIALHNPAHVDLLGIIGGLALCSAAHTLVPLLSDDPWQQIALRWPNDAVHVASGRKLGGVLVEASGQSAVVGLGLNVGQIATTKDWPESIAGRAVSLAELGAVGNRLDAARVVLESFCTLLATPREQVLELARNANALLGLRRTFLHDGKHYQGVVMAIDHQGSISLRTDDDTTVHLPASTTSMLHDEPAG